MLLYPILEWYFHFAIALPTWVWGIVLVVLLVLGILGLPEMRNLVLTLIGGPMLLYLICYVCKAARPLPLLGLFGIILRIAIDLLVAWSLIMVGRILLSK